VSRSTSGTRLGSSADARRGPDRPGLRQPRWEPAIHPIAACSWPRLASRYA
jgi:hypothetical protein